jgi:NTP pyrophosphatase (non-canonical NTP hydrolase)
MNVVWGPSPPLDAWADHVVFHVQRLWPKESVEDRGLALAEEAGETCRAILKRKEGTRKTPEFWTDKLKIEVGQTIVVAMSIARQEGWSVIEVIANAIGALAAMEPETDRERGTGE